MARLIVAALLSFTLLAGAGTAGAKDKKSKTGKNQMVKGTIKLVDPDKDLLVINQKVKNEFVDRELSITEDTDFVIIDGKDQKIITGKEGLIHLKGAEGSSVQVKCDKDVNVLKVTVKLKKKKK